MVSKKKEQLPIEEEPKRPITEEQVIEEPVAEPVTEEPVALEEEAVVEKVPEHSHPELDQIIVKLQEIDQRIANMEMGGEEPGIEKVKEAIKDAPEREPDHEQKKKVEFENPEQIPQTKQPAVGDTPGNDDFTKYDNKAKDVEGKAIAATPNASGKIPKNESIKVKLDIEDEKGDAPQEEEAPMAIPQKLGNAEEQPGLKPFGEVVEEEDETGKLKESEASDETDEEKIKKELTKRQSVVGGNSNNIIAKEQQMQKSVEAYLKKTNHFSMFNQVRV